MFGWEALKSEMTCLNAFCWLGSSPPPRQQNHLIVTGPPGGTVAGATLAGWLATAACEGVVDAAAALAGALGGEVMVVDPPHAPTSSATIATKTPGRNRRDAMKLLLLWRKFPVSRMP